MFNKRKNQANRKAQPSWQEPKVDPAAASGAGSGTAAGNASGSTHGANTAGDAPAGQGPRAGGAPAAHPQPGAAKQAPSRPDASAVLNRQPNPPVRPEASRRAQSAAAVAAPACAGQPAASHARAGESSDHKRLLVGREISLSGEIRSCDTLVVEGTVEAELNGTQLLDVQQSGLFKGSATVDTAEIAGRFEGNLTVRERLHVHATGNIHGEIKYKNLEIDSGGRVGGTLMELSPEEAETAHHTAGVGNGAAGAPSAPGASGASGTHGGGAPSGGPDTHGADACNPGTPTGASGGYANGAGAAVGGDH